MHEPEAAKLLAIKQNKLRAMRRDGRLIHGEHYIFATGNLGGPVVHNIDGIRRTHVERTISAVQEKGSRRKADFEGRLELIETYGEDEHPKQRVNETCVTREETIPARCAAGRKTLIVVGQ